MPPISFLIKPASGSCNMRCRYCFYADEQENRKVRSYGMMSEKTMKRIVDLGLAYIRFAQEEQQLFKLLFVSENRHGKSLYDLLNGDRSTVVKEINSARSFGCKDPGGMFMRMWIFIHGSACMSLTDDYDLPEVETVKLLEECYRVFRNA